MKKRILAVMMAGVVSLSFVACSDSDSDTDTSTDTSDTSDATEAADIEYDVNDYVTLGDYNGIEITITGDYDYSEEGFDEYVDEQLEAAAIYVESDETEVTDESIVDVDYVGSQDGVAFDGGSAEDQIIDVGGNCSVDGGSYIDGFTAGLVGHSVGEEVAYEVTFPETYSNTDLAGQTVVFTFQINYIAELLTADSLTDDIVVENFDYDTVDDFMAAMKTDYEDELASNKDADIRTEVINTVQGNATVSGVPEDLLDAWVDMQVKYIENQFYYNTYTEYTLEEIADYYGQDYDEVLESITSSVEETLETVLVFQCIAEKEGINLDGYDDYMQEILEESGASSLDDLLSFYSTDTYSGEAYSKLVYYEDQGIRFCIDNAVVTVAEAED